jgi:hypothetical protein
VKYIVGGKMYKHIVTSGCSFSDNFGVRWPMVLAQRLDAQLYNRGQGSAGNDWICDSTIYQASTLLQEGIPASEILVVVMWSGIDRTGILLSAKESAYWNDIVSMRDKQTMPNPVAFIGQYPNVNVSPNEQINKGWLLGSVNCYFDNPVIKRYKQQFVTRFHTNESLLLQSLNCWLKLQWFCAANKLKLINLTYQNIWHFPHNPYDSRYSPAGPGLDCPLSGNTYTDYEYLFRQLDMDNWFFYRDTDGMYEWCYNEGSGFYSDNWHPSEESHEKYVDEFLCPILKH